MKNRGKIMIGIGVEQGPGGNVMRYLADIGRASGKFIHAILDFRGFYTACEVETFCTEYRKHSL